MLNKEAEIVDSVFISRTDTYNIIVGGGFFCSKDCVNVKDKNGNNMMVHKTDIRYLSGELVGCVKGTATVKYELGNTSKISIYDERYLSGELQPISKNYITVRDIDNKHFQVHKTDERYLSGELVHNLRDVHHNMSKELKEILRLKSSLRIMGDKNPMFGKHHSHKTKEILREKSIITTEKLKVSFYVYDIDGNFLSEERGIKEYIRNNNLGKSCFIDALRGRRKIGANLYKDRFYYYDDQGINCFNETIGNSKSED